MIKLVSIVMSCTLDQSLDLNSLSKSIEGVILPKQKRNWVNYRIKPENYYIAFYKSGKILITGVKSLEKINYAAQQVLKILEDAGIHRDITKIDIVNIVCLGTLQFNISLEKIIYNLDSHDASYEPELFPGLIYKNWGATFLIF